LYQLSAGAYDDAGDEMHTILRGKHIFNKKNKVRFARLELGIESGVGLISGQGSDPVAGLRISRDGGHTYGTQSFARMGKIGETNTRCIWRNLGAGRDLVTEITITDPIKRVITDATLVLEDGYS
jgi:hypothetical protein